MGLSRKPWLQLLAMRLVKFILIRWGVGLIAPIFVFKMLEAVAHCLPIDQEGKNAMKHFNSEAEFVDFASKERFPYADVEF